MSRVMLPSRRHWVRLSLVLFGFSAAVTAQPTKPGTPRAPTKPATAAQPAKTPVAVPQTTPPATPSASTSTPSGAPTTTVAPTAPIPATGTGGSGDPWATGPATPPPPAPPTAVAPGPGTAPPPPVYYVESVPAPQSQPEPVEAAPRDPIPPSPPMHIAVEEPLPPPIQRHRSPRNALWLGARAGWFVPFGDLWGACNGSGYGCQSTKFRDVAASGPVLELDLGVRLARYYNVYLLWERAQLGKGDGIEGLSQDYSQIRAETDYVAVGVRLSADPDDVGMVLDLALGARRFRAIYEGSNQLQLSQAPLESRLGAGVDIRLSPSFSLSPMLTLGLGTFGKADWVTKSQVSDFIPAGNDTLTHGWVSLQLGGHFDIALGSN